MSLPKFSIFWNERSQRYEIIKDGEPVASCATAKESHQLLKQCHDEEPAIIEHQRAKELFERTLARVEQIRKNLIDIYYGGQITK